MIDRENFDAYDDWSRDARFAQEQQAATTFSELKELVSLAESVTNQIDELSEKLNRTRMQALTVIAVLYLSIIAIAIFARASSIVDFTSSAAGWVSMGAGTLALIIGILLLINNSQRISKLSNALRQEFNVQQGLFTFIDDFLSTIHRRSSSISAVQLAMIHMQVKRLHRPEPKIRLFSWMFGRP